VGRRQGALLGMIALALGVMGLVAPASRTLQLWPDRAAGVTSGLLEGMLAHADPQVLPCGVHRISADNVVRARTYLHFPLDLFPPGTEVLRATLYVYVDGVSGAGEATFGAYRVLEPWEEEGWGDDPTTWPALLTVPIAATEARFDVVTPTLPLSTPAPTSTPALTDTSALFSRPAGHGLLQGAMVTIAPSSVDVALGITTVVSICVENVIGLYSADVCLKFDQALLEVVDADPDTDDVVEIQPGTFLGLDSTVVDNFVDEKTGKIYFSQEASGASVSGSGALAMVTFQGKAVGNSDLNFDDDYVFLEDYGGGQIAAGLQNGSVTVTSGETPVPASEPTHTPTSTSTPTPTRTPTPGPTPTSPTSPLATPIPTPTPTLIPSLSPTVPVVALQRGVGTWLTWDLTALMRAWQAGEVPNHGLALAPAPDPDPDADPETAGDLLVARWLAADDPGTRPYLIVEFEVHPVTPTPAATLVPVLPHAGGPVEWGAVGLLLVGVALLALGLAVRRR